MVIYWEGEGVNEKGYWKAPESDKLIVAVDPRYFRPTKVETLSATRPRARPGARPRPRPSFAGHQRQPSRN